MKLNYPLKDDRLKYFLNAAGHYQINETSSPELNDLQIGGWYPVGNNDFWHSGVHFNGDRPVHAVSDGRVVAYRVTDTYLTPSQLTCQFEEPEGVTRKYIDHPISNNFVLTKHQFKPLEGKPFYFYMLFMHLQPLKELKEDQKKALTIFHTSTITVKRFDRPDGKGLILFNEKRKEIAIMPKGTAFTLGPQNGSPPFDLTWAVKANFSRVHFDFYGESFTGYAQITGKSIKRDNEYIVTTDESKNNRRNGLNIRELPYLGGKVIDIAPMGAELLFDNLEEIVDETATLKKPTDGHYYKKIKGYFHEGTMTSISGYVDAQDTYLNVEKRYNPVVNTVTNPDDLEVRKGDVLGWAGMDGTWDKKKMVHVELFITDKDDLQALRDYTSKQLEKNTDLVQEHLLSLNDANILNEDDINQSYVRLEYVCDVSGLIKKACTENNRVRFFDIRKAVTHDTLAPKLRTMVTKHHSEWLPVDKNEKIKKRLEEPPYLWSPEKYNAYKEIYFENLGFWDQLEEKPQIETEEGEYIDSWRKKPKKFPDECYYFHPIKFIEHLKQLETVKVNFLIDRESGNFSCKDNRMSTLEKGRINIIESPKYGNEEKSLTLEIDNKKIQLLDDVKKVADKNDEINIYWNASFEEFPDHGTFDNSIYQIDANSDVLSYEESYLSTEHESENEYHIHILKKSYNVDGKTYKISKKLEKLITSNQENLSEKIDLESLPESDKNWLKVAIVGAYTKDSVAAIKDLALESSSKIADKIMNNFVLSSRYIDKRYGKFVLVSNQNPSQWKEMGRLIKWIQELRLKPYSVKIHTYSETVRNLKPAHAHMTTFVLFCGLDTLMWVFDKEKRTKGIPYLASMWAMSIPTLIVGMIAAQMAVALIPVTKGGRVFLKIIGRVTICVIVGIGWTRLENKLEITDGVIHPTIKKLSDISKMYLSSLAHLLYLQDDIGFATYDDHIDQVPAVF